MFWHFAQDYFVTNKTVLDLDFFQSGFQWIYRRFPSCHSKSFFILRSSFRKFLRLKTMLNRFLELIRL
jgi:hypothetical protein